ncbi:hypothetical protein ACFSM5_11850 [Lacibacterium aquatile]|uniref:Cell division protein FtsL n=1 Tax=Lacibacterium aquatile TaxID=1168082 RepID=A0ABW5DRN2_9PROT
MWRFFMVWILMVAGVGGFVYQLKYEVARQEKQLSRVNKTIIDDQEVIHVLKAEWSYLNQPAQLDAAARQHLGLEPIKGAQFATVDKLPTKQQAAEPLPVAGKPAKPSPAPVAPAPDLMEESTPDIPSDLEDETPPAPMGNQAPMNLVRQGTAAPKPTPVVGAPR